MPFPPLGASQTTPAAESLASMAEPAAKPGVSWLRRPVKAALFAAAFHRGAGGSFAVYGRTATVPTMVGAAASMLVAQTAILGFCAAVPIAVLGSESALQALRFTAAGSVIGPVGGALAGALFAVPLAIPFFVVLAGGGYVAGRAAAAAYGKPLFTDLGEVTDWKKPPPTVTAEAEKTAAAHGACTSQA